MEHIHTNQDVCNLHKQQHAVQNVYVMCSFLYPAAFLFIVLAKRNAFITCSASVSWLLMYGYGLSEEEAKIS